MSDDGMFDALAEYEDMLRDCEVGEYYDMPLEEGQAEEEVRRGIRLAARNTIGKQVRIRVRDEDGKRILRVFVTNVPATQKVLTRADVLKTFHVQEYYDGLVRQAEPGKAYEIVLTDVPYASVQRHLDTAGRNILRRRLAFRIKRVSKDKLILRYEVTDTVASPIGQHRIGRRQMRQEAMRRDVVTVDSNYLVQTHTPEKPDAHSPEDKVHKQGAEAPVKPARQRRRRDPAVHEPPDKRDGAPVKRPRRRRRSGEQPES